MVSIGKAERKTCFELAKHMQNPGPGSYDQIRVFDNKRVVDYSKRISASNSARHASSMGFNVQ